MPRQLNKTQTFQATEADEERHFHALTHEIDILLREKKVFEVSFTLAAAGRSYINVGLHL